MRERGGGGNVIIRLMTIILIKLLTRLLHGIYTVCLLNLRRRLIFVYLSSILHSLNV